MDAKEISEKIISAFTPAIDDYENQKVCVLSILILADIENHLTIKRTETGDKYWFNNTEIFFTLVPKDKFKILKRKDLPAFMDELNS